MNHSGILRWCGEVHFPLALVISRKLARTRVTRALEGFLRVDCRSCTGRLMCTNLNLTFHQKGLSLSQRVKLTAV